MKRKMLGDGCHLSYLHALLARQRWFYTGQKDSSAYNASPNPSLALALALAIALTVTLK